MDFSKIAPVRSRMVYGEIRWMSCMAADVGITEKTWLHLHREFWPRFRGFPDMWLWIQTVGLDPVMDEVERGVP